MFEDKQAVVIDNGTGYIKAGISGDEVPKAYFSTVVGYTKYEIPGFNSKNCFIGEKAFSVKER